VPAAPKVAEPGRARRDRANVAAADQTPTEPDADQTPEARPLSLLDPCAWTRDPPARQWTVPDWIPRNHVTGLYGDGGVGKSLLAQQLASCVALALPWVGLETLPGRALGVFCEDSAEELERRQSDINRALGVEARNLESLRLLSRFGEDNTLLFFDGDRGRTTPFFDRLAAACRAWKPSLIVLDTAADLFGGNENDRPKVRAFIGSCLGRLARDHDAAVVLCAHPSVAGLANGSGAGGSTAWNNTLRSRLYLTHPASDPDQPAGPSHHRVLTRMKANYAPRDARVEIEWRAGAFAVKDISRPLDDAATWQAIGAMFDELERAWNAKRAWSYRKETRKGGRYFPAWARTHLGVPEDRTAALLADWLMNDCLAFEMFDRDAKTKGLRVVRRPDR
jgi:RecA-family ATPase